MCHHICVLMHVCDWPGGGSRLSGLPLHALRAAQEVLPHGELHISGDVRRGMAYLHRSLQETNRAHGVLHLLCCHGDRCVLGTGQQERWLEWAVLWAAGQVEGRTGEVGLSPPRHPAQLPGDERKKSQQCQATDYKHTKQQAKSSVWWWAMGARNRGSHNMDEQMVITRVRGDKGHRERERETVC